MRSYHWLAAAWMCAATAASAQLIGVTAAGETVHVSAGSGEVTFIGLTGIPNHGATARDSTGRIIAANKARAVPAQLVEIDPVTGDSTHITISLVADVRSMAFHPEDDTKVYVVENQGAIRKNLLLLDLTKVAGTEGFETYIGNLSIPGVQGLTFGPDGRLYGWSVGSGLVILDIGEDGLGPVKMTNVSGENDGTGGIQTLAFSPSTGILYGMHEALFVVDPETGDYEQKAHADVYSVRGFEFLNPCPADVDMNGSLDIVDFVGFQNAFVAGEPAADCNEDGQLNIFDFVCFQNLFTQGCDA